MCSTRHCAPRLQLTMAPLRQVVHVLKQFWPGHHTWCRIWRSKVWASAFRISANFLAHVDANSCELVLDLRAVSEVLNKASLLILRTLQVKACEGNLGSFLQLRCLLRPRLQFTVAPFRQVVHVLKQLWPGHHSWRRIWRYEVWTSALRIGPDFLAHVHANTSELILQLRAVLQVSCHARCV